MTIPCHLIPYEIGAGPANMALDEALLDRVARLADGAYLRTYGWSEPTLSLGYFQRLAEVETEPRWRLVPLVRRPTGGGAIWHHYELTYALVLPATHSQARPNTALYRAVHAAILETLRAQGVEASRRGDLDPAPRSETVSKRPFFCFADRDPEDIVMRGVKVVGSAQRRRVGAILQHGSILLQRSPSTPQLPGICDLAEVPEDPRFWSDRILHRIAPALGLMPQPCELPPEARRRAADLERTLYRKPAWTRRR